jgi:hypothetical protein
MASNRFFLNDDSSSSEETTDDEQQNQVQATKKGASKAGAKSYVFSFVSFYLIIFKRDILVLRNHTLQ